MLSSLGFHTITLSLRLLHSEAVLLISDFKSYSEKYGLIQIYQIDETGCHVKYNPNNNSISRRLKITYLHNYTGITWYINFYDKNKDYKIYTVEAKINPKILSGVTDYLTAATLNDLNIAIINFNQEAKRISSILQEFRFYNLIRLDYCINFSLNELFPTCDAKQIITLIQKSHIPKRYKLYKEYDNIAHRTKPKPGSFYIYNDSITINCYSKYIQLLNLSVKNVKRGRPPVPEETLNKAKDIIRFEVQCHYPKAYTLSHRFDELNLYYAHNFLALFTRDKCKEMITYYFNKIIGNGDWCSLSYAIAKIKLQNYNSQKENRLIETLKSINRCRSVCQASQHYTDKDYDRFLCTLNELNQININPVTIPQHWGIKQIPNLLNTYFEKEALTSLDIESSPWVNVTPIKQF